MASPAQYTRVELNPRAVVFDYEYSPRQRTRSPQVSPTSIQRLDYLHQSQQRRSQEFASRLDYARSTSLSRYSNPRFSCKIGKLRSCCDLLSARAVIAPMGWCTQSFVRLYTVSKVSRDNASEPKPLLSCGGCRKAAWSTRWISSN